jgi:hypothetical protein
MVQSLLKRDFDRSRIVGSISDDIKQAIVDMLTQFVRAPESAHFGESIQKRLKVIEISVKEKADEPKKTEARVVVEVDVTEGAHTAHCSSSCHARGNLTDLRQDMLNGYWRCAWWLFCIPSGHVRALRCCKISYI